jgi:hypothetical protein
VSSVNLRELRDWLDCEYENKEAAFAGKAASQRKKRATAYRCVQPSAAV